MYIIIGVVLLFISYRIYQHFFPAPNIVATGKYVLISGCDTGFGHKLALELDRLGFHVFAGVYMEQNKATLGKLLSTNATVFRLDITQQADIDAAYDLVTSQTNTLHGLVNNAGIGAAGLIDWITADSIRQVMDVNFFGHVAMTKKFLPLLITKSDSRVVNVCSVAGYLAAPGMSAYSASKFALESFSDCLRREMSVWGLRVSIIEPGFMKTAIIEGHDKALGTLWEKTTQETKDRWGDQYMISQQAEINNNPLIKYAENPTKVVRAMQHAIINTQPCIRYRPGWQSGVLLHAFSYLPAWFVDKIISMNTNDRVIPAGVRKQSSG